MTQKSKEQRTKRRRRWFDVELPTLLVRLRLVGEPEVAIERWKGTPWSRRSRLREYVAHAEAIDESLNQP